MADAGVRGFKENGFSGMIRAMQAEERRQYEAGQSLVYYLAQLEGLAGNGQEAVNYLRSSIAAGEELVMMTKVDPAFRLIRGSPAFQQVVAELGL